MGETSSRLVLILTLVLGMGLEVAAVGHKGVLVPPPDLLTIDMANCIVAQGYGFVVVRAYQTIGKVDPSVINNIQVARAAKIQDVAVSMSPCLMSDAEEQTKEMLNALKGQTFSRVFINIDVPGWKEFKNFNQMFLESIIEELKAAGKLVGILSSKFQWEEAFGDYYSEAAEHSLMYVSLNKDPSFNDFQPFGGWTKPYAKHYESGANVCNLKLELAYKEASGIIN